MNKRAIWILLLAAAGAHSGTPGWSEAVIFPQWPLEAKLGTFSVGTNADVLAIVLTNEGANNNLYAITVPSPYNGTNVSVAMIDSGPILFGLGDLCQVGTTTVATYVEGFDVKVARFFDGDWSTATLPGTTGPSFTTADCAVTQNGLVISGQNFDASVVSYFISNDQGSSFVPYGSFGDGDIASVFVGAVRDQLVSAGENSSLLSSFTQRTDGTLQVTWFNVNVSDPNFSTGEVLDLSEPKEFTEPRESAGRSTEDGIIYAANADGNLVEAFFPFANPTVPMMQSLGPLNSNGSQFGFQSITVVPISGGGAGRRHVVADEYHWVGYGPTPTTEPNYPNAHVGGPVSGCLIDDGPTGYQIQTSLLLPVVGTPGTKLLIYADMSDQIFPGDFESSLPSRWVCGNRG